MHRARAYVGNRNKLLHILKLGFQRGDLDLRLLDETLTDVRLLVSVLLDSRDNLIKIQCSDLSGGRVWQGC